LTFLFLTTYSSAQDSVALKQQYYFQYLYDSSTNKIEYSCGWEGFYSNNLYCIRHLISDSRFDLIVKLPDSKTASTKYLAAKTLLLTEKKMKLKLDSQTINKIELLKQNEETIPFCTGCTGIWIISIDNLLDKKSKSPMAKRMNDWINSSFMKRNKHNRK